MVIRMINKEKEGNHWFENIGRYISRSERSPYPNSPYLHPIKGIRIEVIYKTASMK